MTQLCINSEILLCWVDTHLKFDWSSLGVLSNPYKRSPHSWHVYNPLLLLNIDALMFLVRAYHMITLSLSSQQLNRTADTQKLNPRILKGNRRIEQLYRTRQHFVCSEKTDTTTPGKLGRAVEFTQGQAGQVSVFRLYCNSFMSGFTLLSVSLYLF